MKGKILLTGGNGFIGSHTAVSLIEGGYEVVIVDNLSNSRVGCFEAIKKVSHAKENQLTLIQCSLLDYEKLDEVFDRYGPFDGVIHFAAFKHVGESQSKPLEYYENNICGSIQLLKVMKKHNCKRLIFSSSCTVYGDAVCPFDETTVTGHGIEHPYGETKFMMERIFTDVYNQDKEWCMIILRYFNPIGAHPSGDMGEDPSALLSNLVPFLQQVAIGKQDHINIFGTDYDTPDGTCLRDYIHVMDIAEGHVKALEYMEKMGKKGYDVFNLGTGKGSSVYEVIHAMEKACGFELKKVVAPRRAGDRPDAFAITTKAETVLGWKAKYTLEDACRDAWNWQHKHPEGYADYCLFNNCGVKLIGVNYCKDFYSKEYERDILRKYVRRDYYCVS